MYHLFLLGLLTLRVIPYLLRRNHIINGTATGWGRCQLCLGSRILRGLVDTDAK